eukprot:876243_1
MASFTQHAWSDEIVTSDLTQNLNIRGKGEDATWEKLEPNTFPLEAVEEYHQKRFNPVDWCDANNRFTPTEEEWAASRELKHNNSVGLCT